MKDDIKAWIKQAREGTDPVAQRLADEVERMDSAINKPELNDFVRGVLIEAAHQDDRWGPTHDAVKTPSDWFWLLGYVGGKLLAAAIAGKLYKARHHCITTAAIAYQWFCSMRSEGAPARQSMRWTGVWDKEGREICAGDTVRAQPYVEASVNGTKLLTVDCSPEAPPLDVGVVRWRYDPDGWFIDTGIGDLIPLEGKHVLEILRTEQHL